MVFKVKARGAKVMTEILTWFGMVDPDKRSCEAFRGTDEIIEALLAAPLGDSTQAHQPDLRELANECGLFKSDAEYNLKLREMAIALVKRQLRSLDTAEAEVLQMVESIDDLNQAVNLLDERLYEWSRTRTEEISHGQDLALSLSGKGAIGVLADSILDLRSSRGVIESKLSIAVNEIAPNLSSLAGPTLTARLISRAGSLKRLAEMPSSTIQVMGAEKSLFKHLKGKAPSPKHGLIYRHPVVMGSPRRLKGRAARMLSGKLAIAARIDYFSGKPDPELKNSLDKRMNDLRRSGSRKGACSVGLTGPQCE